MKHVFSDGIILNTVGRHYKLLLSEEVCTRYFDVYVNTLKSKA